MHYEQRVNGAQKAIIKPHAGGSGLAAYAKDTTHQSAPSGGLFSDIVHGLTGVVGGLTRFKLNTQGLYSAKVSVPLIDLTPIFHVAGVHLDHLRLSAHNALLAEAWTAHGTQDAQHKIQGLMPTALLNNTLVNQAQSILSTLPIGKELDANCLDFGRVDLGPVPNGRLGKRVGKRGPGFPDCHL